MFAHPILDGLSPPADAVALQALSFRVARCTRGSYDHICPWWEWPTLHAIVPWASNSKPWSSRHDTTCHTKRWCYTPLLNNTCKNPGLVYSGITLGQCATSIESNYMMIPELLKLNPGNFWTTQPATARAGLHPFALQHTRSRRSLPLPARTRPKNSNEACNRKDTMGSTKQTKSRTLKRLRVNKQNLV